MKTFLALFLCSAMFAADRQVAITIDDLPRGGDGGGTSFEMIRTMTEKLLFSKASRFCANLLRRAARS
jgi:hypothetical protein